MHRVDGVALKREWANITFVDLDLLIAYLRSACYPRCL